MMSEKKKLQRTKNFNLKFFIRTAFPVYARGTTNRGHTNLCIPYIFFTSIDFDRFFFAYKILKTIFWSLIVRYSNSNQGIELNQKAYLVIVF